MTHPDAGTLRRAADAGRPDGPLAEHLAGCGRCRDRLEAVRRDAAFAAGSLSVDGMDLPRRPALAFDPACRSRRPRRTAAGRSGVAAAAVAGAVAVIALTPLGSMAANLLDVFAPKTFVAVPVTRSDAADVTAVLRHLGSVRGSLSVHVEPMASPAQAAAAAGFPPEQPRVRDVADRGTPAFAVVPSQRLSFTFSEAKAAHWEASRGRTLPPMPAGMDGATLTVVTHPVAIEVWPAAASGAGPLLLVAASPLPTTTSTGPTVADIERYVASLPGVPPSAAADVLSLQDPATTLPLPIPEGAGSGVPVSVDGHAGLFVRSAGLRAGAEPPASGAPVAVTGRSGLEAIVWEGAGMIHLVAGHMGETSLLRVAENLG